MKGKWQYIAASVLALANVDEEGQQDAGGRWARDTRTSKLNVWDDGHFARKDSVCYVTAARHLLEAPDDESEPTPQNPTLGVLAIFRDEAMYLTEWLTHYVAEGV